MKDKVIKYLKLIDVFQPYLFLLFIAELIPSELYLLHISVFIYLSVIVYLIFRYINIKEKVLYFTYLIFELSTIFCLFIGKPLDEIEEIMLILAIFLSAFNRIKRGDNFIVEIIKYILFWILSTSIIIIIGFSPRLELIYV